MELEQSWQELVARGACAGAVGGVDEAGRGPLAGPVVAAVVVLGPGQHIAGVRDSKRLSATRRQALDEVIRQESLGWSVASASVTEIDRYNILQATLLAMRRAVAGLARLPETLLIDGNRAPSLDGYPGRVESLVRGDASCPAIGAASILAKVYRDREMHVLDRRYPQFGFARHKGYPTREHRERLRRYGPCPAHRRSFAPVSEAAALLQEMPA